MALVLLRSKLYKSFRIKSPQDTEAQTLTEKREYRTLLLKGKQCKNVRTNSETLQF